MMKASATLVGLCLLVAAASGFMDCPRHCTCTQSSFMGGQARCTFLDPGTQQFPPDISSLVVVNYPEERLPARFFTALGLSGLMTLSMTNGSIAHISKDAFAGLDFLEDLDLSFNRIQKLDPLTFQNSRLKRLSLNGNPLTLYDTSAKDKRFLISESIIELTITDGKISTSDDLRALSGMPNLEFIDLSGNQIRELKDDVFSTLINLEEINLSNNVISHIDRDTFADIEELTSLNLRGNPLKSLEGIEIPGLKDLDVSNCNFEMLTASTLEGFPELSSLNLSQNSILTIDMDIFMSVPGLRDLDLSYNRLRGPINDLLFEFNKKLETVSFRGNGDIKYIPGFKGDFLHLYNYDISACGLTNISNDTFKGMRALVSLNASNNALVHLEPKTFSELPNLVVLDLSNNNLHALNGKLFTGNRELSKLYLSKNYFRHLTPLLFQSTPKLHHLDISNCRLTSLWNISESFTMRNRNILSKLIDLNVSGNRLTKLHTHYFISMESLQKLDISNNPIECTPDFSRVMEWLIVKKVMPNKKMEHAERMDLIESNVQWDEVLRSVCPEDLPRYNTVQVDVPTVQPLSISSDKGIDIPIMEETPLVWPMALVWASIFSIVFALANIIGLLIYRSRRNYTVLGYKSQLNSALDGHFPVRRSGRPMYQKLYEECSVPAPIHSGNNKLHIVAILGNKLNKNNSDV